MPPFVHLLVIVGGIVAVASGWDDRGDIARRECLSQPTGVKGPICQQMIGGETFDQLRHGAQIVCLPGQQPEIDEVPERISQRQYLGRDAAA